MGCYPLEGSVIPSGLRPLCHEHRNSTKNGCWLCHAFSIDFEVNLSKVNFRLLPSSAQMTFIVLNGIVTMQRRSWCVRQTIFLLLCNISRQSPSVRNALMQWNALESEHRSYSFMLLVSYATGAWPNNCQVMKLLNVIKIGYDSSLLP